MGITALVSTLDLRVQKEPVKWPAIPRYKEYLIGVWNINYRADAGDEDLLQDGQIYYFPDKGVLTGLEFHLEHFNLLVGAEMYASSAIDLRINDRSVGGQWMGSAIPADVGFTLHRHENLVIPGLYIPLNDDDVLKPILFSNNVNSTGGIQFAGTCFAHFLKED